MKVIALKNLLYQAKIYNEGASFDIDDVSFYVWRDRGWIKPVDGEVEVEDVAVEGLPSLDDVPKKKK